MTAANDDFFDPKSFEGIELQISVINTATRREMKSKNKVQLLELLDRGMILDLPAKFASAGAYLVLTIDARAPGEEKPLRFKSGARVEELVSVPGGDRVTVSLLQHDQAAWDQFCGMFGSRQAEIEKFFKAARGE
jgi:hypothetical protein